MRDKPKKALGKISHCIFCDRYYICSLMKSVISENGSFIKNQIKWAISSSMVSKEVCSWPGESAWSHLTGGADEGGQNVWVQESSCWTWSSPSSPRGGTTWSGCCKAAPPCERDRSQLSAWPILSANLKRSQNHQHHDKNIDFKSE